LTQKASGLCELGSSEWSLRVHRKAQAICRSPRESARLLICPAQGQFPPPPESPDP